MLSYFYDPSIFIFRWSSNFMEKVVLERVHGGQDGTFANYLVYYYCT